MTIEQLDGRLGYAPISVRGAITFADVRNPTVELQTTGENVLLTRSTEYEYGPTCRRRSLVHSRG